ncbi:MAG: AAA family ATPase [Aureispira sp.]
MFTKLRIQNYKSIHDLELELGRVNVFIGENGCGKSNILEAVALLSTAKEGRLRKDDLANKGIRVARFDMMRKAFEESEESEAITIDLDHSSNQGLRSIIIDDSSYRHKDISPQGAVFDKDRIEFHKKYIETYEKHIELYLKKIIQDDRRLEIYGKDHLKKIMLEELKAGPSKEISWKHLAYFATFTIYEIQTNPLRGFSEKTYETPGRNGENLDLLLSQFSAEQWAQLHEYNQLIAWLDEEGILIDENNQLRLEGLRLRSNSKLGLRDKFMAESKNTFSIENANEGALHILFYLALLISDQTPPFFAIDNIENALNPKLCRELVKNLVLLSKENDKQSLITTHNPAVLDGLNLHDDEQRLFVVRRNKKGHTAVKRIQLKPDVVVGGHRLKLSELWMRGQLGGLPQNF